MASRRRGPGWRDEAAAALLLRFLPGLSLRGRVLLMGELRPEVPEAMKGLGLEVHGWCRRGVAGFPATSWPPAGPYDAVFLRLPRSREALAMALHAAAGVLAEKGRVFVYGAKDEGISSAPGVMEELFAGVGTLGVGGRCRILQGEAGGTGKKLKTTLDDWRDVWNPELDGLPERWVSYPGVFAHGRVDPGTRLLLDVMPPLSPGARVLDYGCGSGILGGAALAREPGLDLHLLDVDAVALEAARKNVPRATHILGDGLAGVASGAFDAILSNPPFHRGKDEDPEMLRTFVREAARVLTPKGLLAMVTQRRISLEEVFESCFGEVALLAGNATFAVWLGRFPRIFP